MFGTMEPTQRLVWMFMEGLTQPTPCRYLSFMDMQISWRHAASSSGEIILQTPQLLPSQDFTYNTFPRINKKACMKIDNTVGPTAALKNEEEATKVI